MSHAIESLGLYDCRDAWVKILVAFAEQNDRIVTVVNDLSGSSKLGRSK